MTGPEQSVRDGLRTAAPDPAPDTATPPAPAQKPGLPARLLRSAGRGVAVGGRGVHRWSRRPWGRFVLPAVAIAVILAATGATGRWGVPAAAPPVHPSPSGTAPSAVDSQAPAPGDANPVLPSTTPELPGASTRPVDALAGWARKMSPATSIPVTALQAYGFAQLTVAVTTPGCQLAWTTLAGIGKVESDHGSANGAVLQPDGRALPPIIGVALDGQAGRQLIRDTDGGTLDGDRTYDHAVGPMQFLPATWRQYGIDADGDGAQDPNDINDAALAAANYLCAGGRVMSSAGGWWSGILSYNALQSYAQDVFEAADQYGRLSRTVT